MIIYSMFAWADVGWVNRWEWACVWMSRVTSTSGEETETDMDDADNLSERIISALFFQIWQ